MEDKVPLSVMILTKNSGGTLERALMSVSRCADVYLCDGGSSDNTKMIAATYGVRVVEQDGSCLDEEGNITNFACARNICASHALFDWVLYIDADEEATPELIEELRGRLRVEGNSIAAYKVPVSDIVHGRRVAHSTNYPGYQLRVFRRSSGASFIRHVHERINLPGDGAVEIGVLQSPWLVHITEDEIRHYIRENIKYVRMQAKARAQDIRMGRFIYRYVLAGMYISLRTLLKAVVYRVRYGRVYVMPFSLEAQRAAIPLLVMFLTGFEMIRRICSRKI